MNRFEVDQVCVDYHGTVALYEACLHLPSGCICGLVGMNGAGKSTFVRNITGVEQRTAGEVYVD